MEKPVIKNLIPLFMICFLGTAFGGTISTLMSVYLPVVITDIKGTNETNGPQGAENLNFISGYINSIFIFGWAVGGFFWGLISDRIGRKHSLLAAIASCGVFTVLTGLMVNWPGIVMCRFMSGFGVGGILVITVTLLTEVWPQKSKAVYIGIISISFPIGIISAGLINYFFDSWRSGFLIGIAPIILALSGYWLLAESEIWQAHQNIKNMLSTTSQDHLFSAENSKKLITGSLIFGSMLIGLWAIFSWLPTWIQSLIKTDAPKERGLSMMFLGMGGLVGGFTSGWLVKIAGLRKSLICCFVVCILTSFVMFKTNFTFSNIIYGEIAILALFFGASQGILSVYIPELFSTPLRAAATGVCFNAGRLLTATAVLFVGILVTSLGGYGNALFIFSFVFIVGLIAMLLIKNIQNEEINIQNEEINIQNEEINIQNEEFEISERRN